MDLHGPVGESLGYATNDWIALTASGHPLPPRRHLLPDRKRRPSTTGWSSTPAWRWSAGIELAPTRRAPPPEHLTQSK